MRETRIDVAGEAEDDETQGGTGAKMSKTTEIKPGLDLNLAVLKVLGAAWRDDWKDETGWKMAAWYYKDGSVACRDEIPQFSTDLNAAFAAAEKARLFDNWGLGLFGQWEVMSEADHIAGRETLATGATPALAICAAILKTKG